MSAPHEPDAAAGQRPSGQECPACVASRKAVVDAYFDGYLAGAVEAYASDLGRPGLVFCLPHEKMATTVIAAMAKALQAGGVAEAIAENGGDRGPD